MAKYRKIYKTRSNEARIPLQLGDVTVDAHFMNGNIRDNQWATLETTDALVQFVIENSPLFGKKILLDNTFLIEDEKPIFDVEKITTYSQLRDYLVSEYGCDRNKIGSPNAMKARVKEFGIELPNMVW